jgi:hypothetical protein
LSMPTALRRGVGWFAGKGLRGFGLGDDGVRKKAHERAEVALAAGGAGRVGGDGDGEGEVGDDRDELAAVAAGEGEAVAAGAAEEPAVAVVEAGEGRAGAGTKELSTQASLRTRVSPQRPSCR